MHCPVCQTTTIKPTGLQPGLPALVCTDCNGHWVDLLDYRTWLERQPKIEASTTAEVTTDNTSKALLCPKCSRLMNKFNISADKENKVDLCLHCDEVWLDDGEWQLLLHLQLHDKLTDIITHPWQSDLRKEQVEQSYRQRYLELLGEEDMQTLETFKQWLEEHPKRFEIINYLRN